MIPLSTPNRFVPTASALQKQYVSPDQTRLSQGSRLYFGSETPKAEEAAGDSLKLEAATAEATAPTAIEEKKTIGERLRAILGKYLYVPEFAKNLANKALQPFKNLMSKAAAPFKAVGRVIAAPFKPIGRLLAKPFSKIKNVKVVVRLRNGWDNALGYPRHAKFVKAGIWAGATFAIGLIPPFHALIAAAPVTFMTTFLVDFAVGLYEGLSSDPEQMRGHLDALKAKHYPPKPPEEPAVEEQPATNEPPKESK